MESIPYTEDAAGRVLDVATHRASSNFEQQCQRVLRCTEQDLANGPGGLRLQDRPSIRVSWARHLDEVRAAQRLRYTVFAVEMGARLNTPLPGHDMDLFDNFCEHLLVCDETTGMVIGTYRVLTPVQAKRVGSTYSDTEFDLTRLRVSGDRSRPPTWHPLSTMFVRVCPCPSSTWILHWMWSHRR